MFLLFVKAAQTIQTASLPILALSGEHLNSVTSSSVIFGIKYVISRVHFCIRIQKIKIKKWQTKRRHIFIVVTMTSFLKPIFVILAITSSANGYCLRLRDIKYPAREVHSRLEFLHKFWEDWICINGGGDVLIQVSSECYFIQETL